MVMYKRNMEAFNALNFIAKAVNRNLKTFNYAGNKDKRALTFQFLTSFRTPIPNLQKANEKLNHSDILIGRFKVRQTSVRLGDLYGNRFTISLRHINDIGVEDLSFLLKHVLVIFNKMKLVRQLRRRGL